MKKLLFALALIPGLSLADDISQIRDATFPNQAGTLTHLTKQARAFCYANEHYAWFTAMDGQLVEGCWSMIDDKNIRLRFTYSSYVVPSDMITLNNY